MMNWKISAAAVSMLALTACATRDQLASIDAPQRQPMTKLDHIASDGEAATVAMGTQGIVCAANSTGGIVAAVADGANAFTLSDTRSDKIIFTQWNLGPHGMAASREPNASGDAMRAFYRSGKMNTGNSPAQRAVRAASHALFDVCEGPQPQPKKTASMPMLTLGTGF